MYEGKSISHPHDVINMIIAMAEVSTMNDFKLVKVREELEVDGSGERRFEEPFKICRKQHNTRELLEKGE